jgi:hypothetical protein
LTLKEFEFRRFKLKLKFDGVKVSPYNDAQVLTKVSRPVEVVIKFDAQRLFWVKLEEKKPLESNFFTLVILWE